MVNVFSKVIWYTDSSIESHNFKQPSISFFSPLHKNNITLDELIGCGTYGKVYSGKMKGDPVAIKIIDTRKAPQKFVDKFLPRELELAKRVDHVNLQRIVLDFKTRREHYIITDLAQFDLLQYMKAKGMLHYVLT